MQLVLSLFSGIGMLDRAFSEAGFCVVSAGDLILGQDIRDFRAVAGRFDGVIGGSPCQDFSKARRTPPTGNGVAMLAEFERVVLEARPRWFLLENVPQVPDIAPDGYFVQRFNLNALECGSTQNRNRRFQFGSLDGLILDIKRDPAGGLKKACVTASEGNKQGRRGWAEFCELQGLPRDFDLPDFTTIGAYRAVGNGVNLLQGGRVASAIREATTATKPGRITDARFCACGCGRMATGKQKSAGPRCRKELQIRRERARRAA